MIIGIKYGHMHVGFTLPSIMKAFKQHCLELIEEKNKDDFKSFIKFLWGIRISNFDNLHEEIESISDILKDTSNARLSDKSLSYLDESEREDYIKSNKNINDLFISSGLSGSFFTDIFIRQLKKAAIDNEKYFSIGSMLIRPDMVDEYGWNYPIKIPDAVKNL